MIKATGITAEYNPLHNGHVFLLQKARETTSCDAVVVAMSGDYVQRGEPALMDKWTRCRMALEAGADLVTEIPAQFCLGNASQYASASVTLLEALGCGNIAFGSESGDARLIARVADVLRNEKDSIDPGISSRIKEGMSYPAARSASYRDVRMDAADAELESELSVLSSPNDILAVEYLMNMRKALPVCIKRAGAQHNELAACGDIRSAASIRRILKEDYDTENIRPYIPDQTYEALISDRLVFPDEFVQLLKYSTMMTDAEEIEDCPSAGEGLGRLIKTAARDNDSWDGIIMAAKSKRYTYTRISRLCMQIITGIRRSMITADKPQYIRVLGFSEKGRQHISELKHNGLCDLPIVTNINKEAGLLSPDAAGMLKMDVLAADIYNQVSGIGKERSDHIMRPVII